MQPTYLNTKGKASHTYDAIVVGSGISGGWAAKELCERGLKTLVLERGRQVNHITDYTTALKHPWEFPFRLGGSLQEKAENPVQSVLSDEGNKHFFVTDQEHPYIQETPFSWIRGYQVGGRSLTWGRQCYRLSDLDFTANAKEGVAVDWPIRYKDIAPWYDHVERFVGISGQAEGLAHLPDGVFLPPMEMNCIETHFASQVRKHYTDRIVTIGRTANLTRGWNGRGPCMYRNLCSRGCPYGGYFSSNSATLPAAAATNNLTLCPDSIVIEVLYDEQTNRATGVRVMDAHTKEVTDYFAQIIFLNASTIATASILLQSTSRRFPNGLGNSSGQVGHNLMDHFMMGGAWGEHDDYDNMYYEGRRPASLYIPRFRNLDARTQRTDYQRGFAYQGDGERSGWTDLCTTGSFGKSFKDTLTKPGPWSLFMGAWGETLPYYDNQVSLDATQRDQWGLPLVRIRFQYHENEHNMRADIKESAGEMLHRAGFRNIEQFYYDLPPGSAVHEMGTARMGRDPKTSVLNEFNQLHDVPNVYITDGSCMTSSTCQNPSLTYMALTARACAHAVSEHKKLNL